MRNVLLFTLCCFYSVSFSQKNKDLIWDEKPQFSTILPANINENVVGILIDEKYEFYYNAAGDLEALHTEHRKYRLNNDEAINQYNKIWVSLSDVIEMIAIKARSVKPNGNVIEFDSNNIKEVKDEDNGNSYKIFAIDGIEKGDDIEYYVIRKISEQNFGRMFFQYSFPVQKGSFEIISPKNLIYAVKGYNGFPDATHVVLDDERNQFRCELENIPLLKDEKFSYFTPLKARIEYRLDFNYSSGKAQKLTWDDAAQRIYSMMYLDVDAKAIDKWIKLIPNATGTKTEQAAQIEDYLKSNIYLQDFNNPDFNDLELILKNKVTSAKGMVKLYANLFKKLDIKHQLVLTSERSNVKFDGDFQSWNYLDKYLIYLPEGDTYIDPSNNSFRIGCVDGEITATDGLFVELVRIGSFESAIGKIKFIKPTAYDANYSNMHIDVSIDVDKYESEILTTIGFKGLSGGYVKNFYKMMDDDQKQKVLKNLTHIDTPNATFVKLEVLPSSKLKNITDAEFIVFADYITPSVVEVAGNKLLVNIGATIGPQVEMYFENERQAIVENGHNRMYYREITFHIPDGYKVVNPEVSDLTFIEKIGDENIFGFVSTHTNDDQTYKVVIDEYYKNIFADHSHFDGFKNVVNAAADFNKVVLVLEKK